jgi:hypothetical protein
MGLAKAESEANWDEIVYYCTSCVILAPALHSPISNEFLRDIPRAS